jgi:hypothetical protein
MDNNDEEQSEDIDHDMALTTADALAAVIAADPPFSDSPRFSGKILDR